MTDSNFETTDDIAEYIQLTISQSREGERLDKAIAVECPQFSRTRLKSLIESGHCMMNDETISDASRRVKPGDRIVITLPPLQDSLPKAENILLDIIYEDDSLVVINKSAGMVVHPAVGNETGTVVNAILYHCGDSLSGINGVKRPGIVHRLDKDTTGLMIVAKTDQAHHHLSLQLQDRSLSRVYEALVFGQPFPHKGKIEFSVGRHPSNRLKMAVVKNGRDALTYYETKKNFGEALALVECRLATGRTHQIRVHFEKIKHPLVGDIVYGLQTTAQTSMLRKSGYDDATIDRILNFPRQALHAKAISFIHPVSGESVSFETDLPDDLQSLIETL